MNVQSSQIQVLITEIDEVLSQPNLRLPWVVFGETVTRSRQVLERVRRYLVFLKEQVDQEAFGETEQPASISPGMREPLWQAIRREMIYLRTNLTQPLQDEIDRLRVQQHSLIQEIQQLEARKAQAIGQAPPQSYQQQLSREFLQEFMSRLQDSLIQNVTETLNQIETRFLDSVLLTEANSLPALVPESVDKPRTALDRLTPAGRLEQMRQLQAQSDHLLMTLDSSLSVIFEALQRNLQTYSDSLGQSLERMHSLGKQGEVMLTTLVNQLAQQVDQETSSYLQSSLQLTPSEVPPKTGDLPPHPSVVSPPPRNFSSAFEGIFPYAGAEVPRQSRPNVPSDELEEEEPLNITDEFEAEIEGRLSTPTDGLERTLEESLNWDELMVEPSSPDPDSEPESLKNTATEAESSEGIVTPPSQNTDLFGDDFDEIQMLDEDRVSEDIETLLLDEDNDFQVAGISEDESEIHLDTEDLFGDGEPETTPITPIESQDLHTESLEETADFLSLNSWDGLGQPTSDVSVESDFSSTSEVIDPVFLESENLFTPAIEQVSPLTDEVLDPALASTTNPFEETLDDLSDIFQEPTFEAVSPANSGVVSARTQQALTGIVSSVTSFPQTPSKPVSLERDTYIQASPDENLLPLELEPDSEQVDSRLLIDRNTLEHLEADLFNLEKPETQPTPPTNSRKLTDSKPQIPTPKLSAKTTSKESQSDEMITFEDLFRDIGMAPSSAQSVSLAAVESLSKPTGDRQNVVSAQALSGLTLDDVFNSLNLAEEETLNWDTEQEEDSLSLEALSREFFKN